MYDHQQSARLGQRVPIEQPGVWIAAAATDLPEAPYQGQLVFRLDLALFAVFIDGVWVLADGVP